MKFSSALLALSFALLSVLTSVGLAEDLPADLKAKLHAKIKQLSSLSTDPELVKAVRARNAAPRTAEETSMTNEKWRGLSVLDPFVRAVSGTALSQYLKTKKDDMVAEIFVSSSDGTKAGFAAKTSNWTHKGMPKHDVPMKGETWIGPLALDDSTGLQMVQFSLPVLDGSKPIGSVVVGLRADKLR